MIKAGVPQGSVLSPLLFNLYVNDISTRVSNCRIFQYADDTVLISRHLNYEKALHLLTEDATHLMDWFDENLIKINMSKTQFVCFRNPLKKLNLRSSVVLHKSNCRNCKCLPLVCVDNVKYLGIRFDSDMSWNTHLTHICNKLRSVSCLLFNQKVFMPFTIRKSIAHALGYSVLRYGITLFANCSELWQDKINRILKGLLKSVGYQMDFTPDIDVFETLQLPTFYSLFLQCVVLRHFWSDDFKRPFISERTFRHSARFETPRCFTRYGKRVRRYYVPLIFNKLPEHILRATTRRNLKKMLTNINIE